MGFEDDPAFKNPGPRPDPTRIEREKRYHQMTPEERQLAWARLREVQSVRARRHGGAPLILGFLAVASFLLAWGFFHYGQGARGFVAIWVGIGLVGFTIIAYVRNLMGGLAKRREDLGPPGL